MFTATKQRKKIRSTIILHGPCVCVCVHFFLFLFSFDPSKLPWKFDIHTPTPSVLRKTDALLDKIRGKKTTTTATAQENKTTTKLKNPKNRRMKIRRSGRKVWIMRTRNGCAPFYLHLNIFFFCLYHWLMYELKTKKKYTHALSCSPDFERLIFFLYFIFGKRFETQEANYREWEQNGEKEKKKKNNNNRKAHHLLQI